MAGGKNHQSRGRKEASAKPDSAALPPRTSIKVTIPSEYAASRPVRQQILDSVAAHHYTPESTFAIKLAVEEALLNAIKHGNRQDSSKQIHLEATITPRQTEIIVEDQGPGFDRARVPDPTLDENLEKCSGRGILLIESYMHKVDWSHGGRRLRMLRKNDATHHPST
jgi:serine/threonine-protein kinase RsbW